MTTPALTAPDACKVFTPPPLAAAMTAMLTDRPGDEWLEPCVGKGVFVDALVNASVPPARISAVGLDVYPQIKHPCGRYLAGTDFLRWSLETSARFDRIIGNPPFVPLHKLPAAVRAAALKVPRPFKGTVPPKANCWYAFLC